MIQLSISISKKSNICRNNQNLPIIGLNLTFEEKSIIELFRIIFNLKCLDQLFQLFKNNKIIFFIQH